MIDEKMAFPGLLALIPCLGAALEIFGADRRQKGIWSIIPGDDLDRAHAIDLDRKLSDHFRGSGVKYVSSTKVDCGNAEKCIMAIGDVPIYFDVFHLTTVGSSYYGERLITEPLSK